MPVQGLVLPRGLEAGDEEALAFTAQPVAGLVRGGSEGWGVGGGERGGRQTGRRDSAAGAWGNGLRGGGSARARGAPSPR